MSNALFLSSRWIDGATLTASSTQGLLSVNNVQAYRPDQVWRATGCAEEWVAWDYGADIAVDAVIPLAHNFSASAMVRIRLAATAADVTAAPAVDSGLVSPWPASGKPSDPDWPSWFSIVSAANSTGYRYGRLDILDPSNPDGFVQIGRLYAGPSFVPAVNIDLNPSLGLVSPGEVVISPFGRTFMDDRGPPRRSFAVSWTALDPADFTDEVFELQRYCGAGRDFAFCMDPGATTAFHKYAMQARFDPPTPAQAQSFWNADGDQVWQTTLTLAEVI